MTEHQTPIRPDDLKQRYLQASAAQNIGPSERVRQAALDHAQMIATAHAAAHITAPTQKAAANRWNFSLVASVAIAGISALLALQFDRSDPQDKEVVLGMPSVAVPVAISPVVIPPTPPAELTALPNEKSLDKPVQEPAAEATQSRAASPSPKAMSSAKAPGDSGARPPLPAPARAAEPAAAKDQRSEAPARAVPAAEPAARSAKTDGENAADMSPESAASRPAVPAVPAVPLTSELPAAPATAQSRASALDGAQFSVPPGPQIDATASRGAAASSMKSRSQSASGAPSASTATSQSAEIKNAAPAASPVASPGAVLRNAARSGQIVVLDQALQQATPAQINSTDDKGRTPLMLATLGGHIGAVQRLLTAGADANLRDFEGRTAAQMAQQSGSTVIDNILRKQPVAQ